MNIQTCSSYNKYIDGTCIYTAKCQTSVSQEIVLKIETHLNLILRNKIWKNYLNRSSISYFLVYIFHHFETF